MSSDSSTIRTILREVGTISRRIDSLMTILLADCRADDRLITPREAAALLGCNERTLRRHAAAGLVPCKRESGRVYFSRNEILARVSQAAPKKRKTRLNQPLPEDDYLQA